MLTINRVVFLAFSVLSVSEQVLGRERWLERDNRPVYLYPRRFGQEQPAVLQKLRDACPGQVCGTLAGQAVTPLLAAQPECSQQDLADDIIDASKQFDAATQANMIAIAQEYRQAEKNTPPDFTTNPPTPRNSVFCQKAPRNAELNGLVQAQDPANDPNLFFDPALKATVVKGSQPNTFPFGTSGSAQPAAGSSAASAPAGTQVLAQDPNNPCVSLVTLTVTATVDPAASATNAVTVSVGNGAAATSAAPPTTTTTSSSGNGNIGDFGRCTVPQIEFGVGFDGRKETSFRPVDTASFNHGSAQNINIITQFICDTLVNTCGADQTARSTCATAETAAAAATKGTGAQADAFNAVFGITTDFAAIASVDNQGNVVPGTGSASGGANAGAGAASSSAAQAANTAAAATTSAAASAATTPASAITTGVNFGSCSTPQIEFGVGFDNRRETSFQPVDKTSFNHGSAQGINIITRFICDTLTNSCKANQAAKDLCSQAEAAASAATAKTGAQADAFNAVFGISTNFASVTPIDDQGRPVGAAANAAAAAPATTTTPAAAQPTTNQQSSSNNQQQQQQQQQANTNTANTNTDTTNTATTTTSGNRQAFSESLGGVVAPTVTAAGNGKFQVEGNSLFNDLLSALNRSCDVQNNKCADAANASGNKGDLTVANCNQQQSRCLAAAKQAQ